MIYNASLRVLKAFCFLAASRYELETYSRHVPELSREFKAALDSIEIGMVDIRNRSLQHTIGDPIGHSARSPARCIRTFQRAKLNHTRLG